MKDTPRRGFLASLGMTGLELGDGNKGVHMMIPKVIFVSGASR